MDYINVQDCSNSIVNELELLHSCTKSLILRLKNYTHGLCFCFMIMVDFTHMLQGYFTGTRAIISMIVPLPV